MPANVDLRGDEQAALLQELCLTAPAAGRWTYGNGMFDSGDAAMLQAMLRQRRPRRLVEIGSGYSTAAALDVIEGEGLPTSVTCVEPYPERLLSLLRPDDHVELIRRPAQDLPPEDLAAMVGPGDVFFIDSTHVVKPGSDVCWLILHTLPLLPAGVIVHIHDVLWPFEYPASWLTEERRNWTEAYLVHAFLLNNDAWRILLFGSYLHDRGIFPADLDGPGSLWLTRLN